MELIDKKKLIAILNSVMYERHKAIVDEKSSREIALENKTIQHVIGIIEKMLVIEFNPVKHGEWSKPHNGVRRCSVCKTEVEVRTVMQMPLYKFCPYCGSIMDNAWIKDKEWKNEAN